VVTAVDGIAIKSAARLRNAIGLTSVSQEVELT
jgi:S1-C subfamily serine protease